MRAVFVDDKEITFSFCKIPYLYLILLVLSVKNKSTETKLKIELL